MFSSGLKTVPGNLAGVRSFSVSVQALAKDWTYVESRRIKKVDYKVGDVKPTYWPAHKTPQVPDYKYGESRVFKQSNHGLYGGKIIAFGDKVSEFGNRSRRTWKPNVQSKTLWSESLNQKLKMKVTTSALRTIEKEGGLDNYLSKDKSARIKELGPFGWKLRFKVLMKQQKSEKEQDIEKVSVDGKLVPVYHTIAETNQKIIVGKRQLLSHLFPYQRSNSVEHLSFKAFVKQARDYTIPEIVNKLSKHKFDFAQVSAPEAGQVAEAEQVTEAELSV